MGAGTGAKPAAMQAPPPQPDATDALIQGRRSALLTLAAKRGRGSTLLTAPQMGSSTVLGGGYGALGTGNGLGGV